MSVYPMSAKIILTITCKIVKKMENLMLMEHLFGIIWYEITSIELYHAWNSQVLLEC